MREEEGTGGTPKPRYKGTELADVARDVYKTNIQSRNRADKIDDVEKKAPQNDPGQPSTIARSK